MSLARIELANGALRFSALEAGSGPLVLCLHGFPDVPETFTAQMTALAGAGYRAVAPAMRGYEPGSQPADGDYHAVRMAEDVVAWLDQLGAERAHLVGHDWGANVAHAAVGLAPARFASVSVLAVPHPVRFGEAYAGSPEQQARSAYILKFLQPGFEEQVTADGCAYLSALWQNWSPGWDSTVPFQAVRQAFAQPGVAHAALEYYRQGFDAVSPSGRATAALFTHPIAVPTLGLCGALDGCIAPEVFEAAMQPRDYPAGLRTARVAGAGHFLHAEAPDAVNARLLEWLAAHPA